MNRLAAFILALAFLWPYEASADLASTLRRFTGYTIVGVMTITGYRDANGKRGDSFEGCEYDRKIILDDSKVLTCATYSYSYSYRPDAVILTNGGDWKMIVGGDAYDMRR